MRNIDRFKSKEYIIQNEFDEFMDFLYDDKVGFDQYNEMRKAYVAGCSFILDLFVNKMHLLQGDEQPLITTSLINQIRAFSFIEEEDSHAD